MKKEEKKILEKIRNNDRHLLNKIYTKYRDPFLNFFKGYNLSEDEIKDVYQDSMIAFYQNGVQGKLEGLNSSIKTYLFGIGKHKAIDVLRKKAKEVKIPALEEDVEEIDLNEKELTVEQRRLHKHFSKLGQSCQSMLRMFYYRGLSIEDIVKVGNYKDANTVKSHKSRCLKQLRALVNK